MKNKISDEEMWKEISKLKARSDLVYKWGSEQQIERNNKIIMQRVLTFYYKDNLIQYKNFGIYIGYINK